MTLPIHQSSEVPKVCRMLRTKMAFGFMEGEDTEPWENACSTTAVYWCVSTMQPAGPDEQFVHPESCREGRACYQAREG